MSGAPNFDPVARIYRWAEYLTLGTLLQRTRAHFLPQLAACRRAIVLGDGDGRFLARLFQQNSALQAIAIDTSDAMLTLLKQRCPNAQTIQTSALTITPAADTDLIVTHFFLDCLTQPEVDRLATNLATVRTGTLWLLSDFGPPRPTLLKPLAALYIRTLYLAFRILTGLRTTHLPDPHTSLASAGFARIDRHERLFGLLYTELWQRQ